MKNNQNIFVSTTFLKDNTKIEEALKICKKINIINVELGSNHLYQKNFYNIISKYKFNFLIHNYFPIPKKSFVINIASCNKNIRLKSIKHAKKAINFCNKVGAKLYTIHPGFLSDPIKSNQDKKNYDFVFEKNKINQYNLAFSNMLGSLKIISKYAKKKNITLAIETEGSFYKKNLLLMQKPSEYRKLFKKFKPDQIKINLNLGHLNLASKAFNFSKTKFIKLCKSRIAAIEISHNNGILDQHLPIKKKSWFLKVLREPSFSKIYKILEFRNTKLKDIKNSIEILKSNA